MRHRLAPLLLLVACSPIAVLEPSGPGVIDVEPTPRTETDEPVATDPKPVDVVIVLDNSPSMEAYAPDVLAGLEALALSVAALEPGTVRFGLTTTEVSRRVGAFVGTGVVLSGEATTADQLVENAVCHAICTGTAASTCAAGTGGRNSCANSVLGASEEGIEAVYMAMCRAFPDPPSACYLPWYLHPDGRFRDTPPSLDDTGVDIEDLLPFPYFDVGQVGSHAGWRREGSAVVAVVITDEGDQSRRMGTDRTGEVGAYTELFAALGHDVTWAVVGPNVDCNLAGAAGWGVSRYQALTTASDGVYAELVQDDCGATDLATVFGEIGARVVGLTE